MSYLSPSISKKLRELEIDLIFEKIDCSGYFFPSERAIIINSDLLDSPDVNFAVMHELGHLLNNHATDIALYNATYVSKSKMEAQADFNAINLLIEIYLEENNLEKEQLNSLKFMETYGIKSSLYDYVSEKLVNYA